MNRYLLPSLIAASAAIAASGQPPPARYYNPRFSADTARVIFESTREGKMAIYSVNLDGTGLRKLIDGMQDDAQPHWSPDASLITFTSNATPGSLNKVFLMRAVWRISPAVSRGTDGSSPTRRSWRDEAGSTCATWRAARRESSSAGSAIGAAKATPYVPRRWRSSAMSCETSASTSAHAASTVVRSPAFARCSSVRALLYAAPCENSPADPLRA